MLLCSVGAVQVLCDQSRGRGGAHSIMIRHLGKGDDHLIAIKWNQVAWTISLKKYLHYKTYHKKIFKKTSMKGILDPLFIKSG